MVTEPQSAFIGLETRAPARRGVLTPSGRRTLLLLVDLSIVVVAVIGALAVWARRGDMPFHLSFIRANWTWFPIMAATWVVAALLNDLYRPNLASRFRETTRRLVRAQAVLVLFYLVIYFVSTPRSLPRGFVFFYAAIATPLLFLSRGLFSMVFARPQFRNRVLVMGAGWAGGTAARLIQEHLANEYDLLGFIDDDQGKHGTVIRGARVLGGGSTLPDLVRINEVNLLVVAITRGISPKLFQWVLACQQAGIGVVSMAALYERTLDRTPVHHLAEQWFLEFEPADVLTRLVKRAMDLAFALVASLGFGLLLGPLALAIWLESPGPIFYRQRRCGRNGAPFWVYKLRSMVPDAEKAGAQWAEKRDPRVTRVGRILRKTRLDELPQVWNILKGDMSLIGPRPERPEFVAQLQEQIPFYRSRLSVKPGLTGWAQVRYRYGSSVEDARIKLEYDLYYIKHQSLFLDLAILFRTVGVVLSMAGT